MSLLTLSVLLLAPTFPVHTPGSRAVNRKYDLRGERAVDLPRDVFREIHTVYATTSEAFGLYRESKCVDPLQRDFEACGSEACKENRLHLPSAMQSWSWYRGSKNAYSHCNPFL